MKLPIQFLFVSVAMWAASQPARIGAPAAGFVFDPMVHGIRPVWGAPGASVAGDPLDIGLSLDSAVVSPEHDFALIVASKDRTVRTISLHGDFESRILAPAVQAPSLIVFSPTGAAAALYAPDSAKLQIFTQLPRQPVLTREIGATRLIGPLLSAAISDDGELALFVTGNRANPATWLSAYGADPFELPLSASAVSFRSASHDVAMATRDGRVFFVRNIDTTADFQALSPADDRVSDPVAVQVSPDGARIFVAALRGTVASIDTRTGSTTFGSCTCAPSGLSPFYSGKLLRLNDFSDGPLMLLDAVNPEPRVWFVPGIVRGERAAQ